MRWIVAGAGGSDLGDVLATWGGYGEGIVEDRF